MNKHHTPHWHRTVHAVHFGFLSGLMAVTFMGLLVATVFSPLWVKQADAAVSNFSAGSFWNTQIPSFTGLHTDSAALVNDVVRQVGQYGATLNKDTAASPIYIADPGATTTTVVPWDCGSGIPGDLANQWQAVPVPFYAVPSSGGQMVVYQPSTATVWEFGHVRNISGQWQACTGGRTSTASNGVFNSPYGISSSGLAVLGGQLSIQELQSGQINHVVGLNLPQVNGISWPATQTSGGNAGSPAMGMRLRLDPSMNVDSLGLTPVGAMIAKAAQIYGFVVWNSGGSVGVTGENPISLTSRGLTDPYTSILSGTSPGSALANFPWQKLEALPQNFGQTASIPTITAFSVSQTAVKADTKVTLTWRANNVTRCAISGIADNLPAVGTTDSLPLKTNTTFTLRCGGAAGTTTSQVSVQVSAIVSNDPPAVQEPESVITPPYAGYANILPELMSGESADLVYKVVYYEQKTYLYETATPPFALNTVRMDNGKHDIAAQIYYRDGRTTQKTLGISVDNRPETLFATAQSSIIKAPPSIPLVWGLAGTLLAVIFMCAGTWWGYHRSHLI